MSSYLGDADFIVDFWDERLSMQNVISFQKISNLQSKIEYEVINEGGNPTPVLLPIPSKQPETITFERGVLISLCTDYWDKLRPGMVVTSVGIYVRKYGVPIRKLEFEQGIVLSKEYPLLNAMQEEVYIEKLQIAHSGLKETAISLT